MSKTYGVGYIGSKNAIAKEIVEQMPSAECFVDLFCGGGAVLHAAVESGKFKNYIANDSYSLIVELLKEASEGTYLTRREWVSKEKFKELKDSDPWVRFVWSFGNEGNYYWCSSDLEEMKRLAYDAVMNKRKTERLQSCLGLISAVTAYAKTYGKVPMTRLEVFERMKRLWSLYEVFDNVSFSSKDYRDVKIPDNAVVYCDPPYMDKRGFNGASKTFDYEKFYDYVRSLPVPVFISGYNAPPDFHAVWEKKKLVQSARGDKKTQNVERLFMHG